MAKKAMPRIFFMRGFLLAGHSLHALFIPHFYVTKCTVT